MKVIGTDASGNYIAVVNHTELEQFLNLYYGKREKLRIGEELDLGKGYDFASQCVSALNATSRMVKENQQVVTAIMQGLNFAALQKEAGQSHQPLASVSTAP